MKRFILVSLIVFTAFSLAAGQTTFNGYNVTNFERAQSKSFRHHKKDIYVSRKNTGDFDAILIYKKRKRFVFADQHEEDTTFKRTYAKLVDRYGKEDKNEDSIPSTYQAGNLKLLASLIHNKRARIYRVWKFTDKDIKQITLIWNTGGVTLAFDS